MSLERRNRAGLNFFVCAFTKFYRNWQTRFCILFIPSPNSVYFGCRFFSRSLRLERFTQMNKFRRVRRAHRQQLTDGARGAPYSFQNSVLNSSQASSNTFRFTRSRLGLAISCNMTNLTPSASAFLSRAMKGSTSVNSSFGSDAGC